MLIVTWTATAVPTQAQCCKLAVRHVCSYSRSCRAGVEALTGSGESDLFPELGDTGRFAPGNVGCGRGW